MVDEYKFDSKKITFSLRHGLEILTLKKRITIVELKQTYVTKVIGVEEQSEIISQIESFEQKWIDLGEEIDNKFQ